jgi:tellurite resistance protein TehA-like permease
MLGILTSGLAAWRNWKKTLVCTQYLPYLTSSVPHFCNTILVISSVLNQRENEENVLKKLMNMRLTHNQLTYRTNVIYAIWTQVLCQWHQIYLTHVLRTRPSSVGTFIIKQATVCVTIAIRLLWFGGCFLITC